jgi:hypothetical protein
VFCLHSAIISGFSYEVKKICRNIRVKISDFNIELFYKMCKITLNDYYRIK